MAQKSKPKFKDIVAYEKSRMLPLNFFSSCILTPIYFGVSALLIIAYGVLMGIDDEKFLVTGILCLGFFAVLSGAFLLIVPFVNKEAIKT